MSAKTNYYSAPKIVVQIKPKVVPQKAKVVPQKAKVVPQKVNVVPVAVPKKNLYGQE